MLATAKTAAEPNRKEKGCLLCVHGMLCKLLSSKPWHKKGVATGVVRMYGDMQQCNMR